MPIQNDDNASFKKLLKFIDKNNKAKEIKNNEITSP